MLKKQMDRLDAGIKEAGEKVNRWKEALLAESRAKEPNQQTLMEIHTHLSHAEGLLQGLTLAHYMLELSLTDLHRDLDALAASYLHDGESKKAIATQRILDHIREDKSL